MPDDELYPSPSFLSVAEWERQRDRLNSDKLLGEAANAAEAAITLTDEEAPRNNLRRLWLDLPLEQWLVEPEGASVAAAAGRALGLVALRSDYLTEACASDEVCQEFLRRTIIQPGGAIAVPRKLGDYGAQLDQLLEEIGEIPKSKQEDVLQRRLASWHRSEMVRIGLRDVVLGAEIAIMMGELSELAEATSQAVFRFQYAFLAAQHGRPVINVPSAGSSDFEFDTEEEGEAQEAAFCIVAMGKGGGRELNFSSDLDLLFVYSDEGETEGRADAVDPSQRVNRLSNHDFFCKLGERFIAFLQKPGPGGPPYRIDMRLRPEGRYGPLARSLASYRDYFAVQARTWERVAYAKARVIAGDKDFGAKIEADFQQFTYAEIYNTEILKEIQTLKLRIDEQADDKRAQGIDLKRASGGIREIEFSLVALQLLYANDVIELRGRRSTQGVLDVMIQSALLDPETGATLREHYLFLRALEQRVQLLANRQTHMLPDPAVEKNSPRLARFWEEEALQLARRLADVRERVRREFEAIFSEREVIVPEALPLLGAIDDELEPDDILLERLEKYRLYDKSSLEVIRRLNHGTREIYVTRRGRQFFEAIFAQMMNVVAKVPCPDAALRYFEDFIRRSRSSTLFFELLAEYPQTLEVVLKTAGSGEFLAELFAGHPEFVDQLFSPTTLEEDATEPDHIAYLRRQFGLFKDRGRRQRQMRRYRQHQTLRLGVRYVLGIDDWQRTSLRLSHLAEACLIVALETLEAEAENKDDRLFLFGLGKLAVKELGFFSDLDVIFVGEGDETRLCERAEELIAFLGEPTSDGQGYEVDARLRPFGRKSTLVPTIDSFANYISESAEVWEHLAYSRLRLIYGATEAVEGIGARIDEVHRRRWKERGEAGRTAHVAEVAAMRGRLEASVGKLPKWAACDFKRGRGGLVDLEFMRQVRAIQAIEEGAISSDVAADLPVVCRAEPLFDEWEPGLAEVWSEQYDLLRRVELATRLISSDSRSLIPKEGERLESLEMALGRSRAGDDLGSELKAALQANREILEKFIGNK